MMLLNRIQLSRKRLVLSIVITKSAFRKKKDSLAIYRIKKVTMLAISQEELFNSNRQMVIDTIKGHRLVEGLK
jgi:hypothetical protein